MKRLSAFLFGEKKEYVFHSDLNVAECLARLKGSIKKPLAWKEMGSTADPDAVMGSFSGNDFQLVKRINYRNSFNPVFYGKLELENSGTKISGYFGLDILVKFFISFWLLGVLSAAVSITFLDGKITFPWTFMPYIMLIFGVVLIKFLAHLGKNEGKEVLKFMGTTLEASPVTPDER